VSALVSGHPLEAATTLGPVIDRAAVDRIDGMVQAAVAGGARIVARSSRPNIGSFSPAILLDGVSATSQIAQEEVFGPVAVLLEADDLDDALRLHNSVAYGLSASIFTSHLGSVDRFVNSARAGIVHVNGETAGAEPHVPFGGMLGSSSWSREQGPSAVEFFTQIKTIYVEGLADAGLFDLT